ncbi:PAS domain-containing protein [Motilimonas sp. KMU-193]|uniref:PAS domain-containing protein n=1 Tax=Motilimonas sp. KMU-193 TaxID=3388668 RepID=UPI00396B46FE
MTKLNGQSAKEVTYSANEQLVSTTDLRGVITYANPIFCDVAGFSAQELNQKTIILSGTPICRQPRLPIYGVT